MSSQTKSNIINSALKLLANEGEKGFSAGKISSEVGISKSTLFHHFSSMDELFEQLLESFVADIIKNFQYDGTIPLSDFIKSAGEFIFTENEEIETTNKIFMIFFQASFSKPMIRKKMSSIILGFKSKFSEALINRGHNKQEANQLALLMAIQCDGFGLYNLMLPENRNELKDAWLKFASLIKDLEDKK